MVGLNLVMPEDWHVPIADFSLHMRILDYLHKKYPQVHIALHAGELVEGLVPPEDLQFHVRDSVEIGHAERIGHGVDVMNETRPIELLREMATQQCDGRDLPHQQRCHSWRSRAAASAAGVHSRGSAGGAGDR